MKAARPTRAGTGGPDMWVKSSFTPRVGTGGPDMRVKSFLESRASSQTCNDNLNFNPLH